MSMKEHVRIKQNPTKIFVEFPFENQNQLDSLYNSFTPTNYKSVERDEIQQLAFRVGKNLKLKKIYGCDFRKYKFHYQVSMIQTMDYFPKLIALHHTN